MNNPSPNPDLEKQALTPDDGHIPFPYEMRHGLRGQMIFLYSGMLFLLAALALFAVAAWMLYEISRAGQLTGIVTFSAEMASRQWDPSGPAAGQPQNYSFIGLLFTIMAPPILVTISAIICIMTGIRLLRAAGVTTKEVIPGRDYGLLASAIQSGNDKAISEYIRLSSLTGVTGNFTKIGLTGLPLATIFLTIVLSIIGIFVPGFFDLAQLTLGAFIGSYVQKQRSDVKE